MLDTHPVLIRIVENKTLGRERRGRIYDVNTEILRYQFTRTVIGGGGWGLGHHNKPM
jgi:hypothetical protein